MYKQKKKRAIDPDAPPRPTLLGHEKQIKDFRTQFNMLGMTAEVTTSQVEVLRRRVNRLENQIEAMTNYINKLRKS
jgi:polyhydroxyalkanoate synthesis regulator phasin